MGVTGAGPYNSATSATYTVNTLGQRVAKTANGTTTLFAYDQAGHLVGDYDGSGNPNEETVYLGDTPVAVIKPKSGGGFTIYYVYTDQLGAPSLITDTANQTVWRWVRTQNPFGGWASSPLTPAFVYNPRFPGQYFDAETGLFYNYFRDYDPDAGRYVESDPTGLRGGINTYVYAGDDPIKFIDPFALAYFARRPLAGLPWLGPFSDNPIDDHVGTAISHAQLFFEDGKSPSNIGFFEDSKLHTELDPEGYHRIPGEYNDCIMRKAVENVPLYNYNLLWNNCQQWMHAVIQEYERLLHDPNATKGCGCNK